MKVEKWAPNIMIISSKRYAKVPFFSLFSREKGVVVALEFHFLFWFESYISSTTNKKSVPTVGTDIEACRTVG